MFDNERATQVAAEKLSGLVQPLWGALLEIQRGIEGLE